MKEIETYSERNFDDIKRIDEYGNEYWLARELQTVLEYKEWRNFLKVVEKSKTACENAQNNIADHFVDINKMPPNRGGTRAGKMKRGEINAIL